MKRQTKRFLTLSAMMLAGFLLLPSLAYSGTGEVQAEGEATPIDRIGGYTQALADATYHVLARQAAVFSGRGGVGDMLSRAMNEDRHAIARAITDRFEARVLRIATDGVTDAPRDRELDRMQALAQEAAGAVIRGWSRRYIVQIAVLDSRLAGLAADALTRYGPAVAADIALDARRRVDGLDGAHAGGNP